MGKPPTHVNQNPRFILRVSSAYLHYSNCLQSEQFMGVVTLKIWCLYQFLIHGMEIAFEDVRKKYMDTFIS